MSDRVVAARTPHGNLGWFHVRNGTNDEALLHGISDEDEYNLRDVHDLEGWALDIGGHIGIVAVGLAIDHPNLHVVAVEALRENSALIEESARQNGVLDRVLVFTRAATSDEDSGKRVPIVYGWSRADNQPDHYMQESRFIGGMVGPNETSSVREVKGIGLADLIELRLGYVPVAPTLLKIDCEGCEWQFLTSPLIKDIPLILGEYHNDPQYEGIVGLLGDSHDVEHLSGTNVGHFRAVKR